MSVLPIKQPELKHEKTVRRGGPFFQIVEKEAVTILHPQFCSVFRRTCRFRKGGNPALSARPAGCGSGDRSDRKSRISVPFLSSLLTRCARSGVSPLRYSAGKACPNCVRTAFATSSRAAQEQAVLGRTSSPFSFRRLFLKRTGDD